MGVPWIEENHRMFVLGLQKLGKGDWLAENYKKLCDYTSTNSSCKAMPKSISPGKAMFLE
ncbi:hypothetical protein HanIR_Chr13g0659021 [Helianthus annuus]|nr:hypothetical protein HanIR_Chr13g0659021 [Helianthus annuus]